GDRMGILAVSNLVTGHVDRTFVVGGHLLQVEAGSLGALGFLKGCHVLLAHHPAHATHLAVFHSTHLVDGPHAPRVGDRLLAPGLEHSVHPVNLRSLGVNNPLGKLHDLGGDTLLGQEHLTHLHGLLVMGDHHLGKHD